MSLVWPTLTASLNTIYSLILLISTVYTESYRKEIIFGARGIVQQQYSILKYPLEVHGASTKLKRA